MPLLVPVCVILDFSRHLILLGALAMVLGMLFFRLGSGLGLPHLFRDQSGGHQVAIGLSLSLLASELFYVSYLVAPKEFHSLRGVASDVDILVYFGVLWGALGVFVLAALLVRSVRRAEDPSEPRRFTTAMYTLLGAEIGVLLTMALIRTGATDFIGSLVRAVSERLLPLALRLPARWDPPRTLLEIDEHVYAAAFFLIFAFLYLLGSSVRRRRIPAAAGLCVLLSIVAAIDGFFVYWLEKWHSLLLIGAALPVLWVLGRERYRRTFADLKDAYRDIETQCKGEEACTSALHAHLAVHDAPAAVGMKKEDPAAWGHRRIDLQRLPWEHEDHKRPLVLVCASGGGIRAAVWTASVLRELEKQLDHQRKRGFPYHVRMISGASGGMVGAAYWVATLEDPNDLGDSSDYHKDEDAIHEKTKAGTTESDWLVANVAKESLSRVATALVFSDLPPRLMALLKEPPSRLCDRGTALEDAFQENMPALSKKLSALRPGEEAGFRPSLVWSPMLVEDGKRLLISNLDLEPLLLQHGPALHGEPRDASGNVEYSRSGYELKRLFPKQYEEDLRLATAARMSASFPFVSPASVLPTVPRRRVVDAGYWDNYGVNLACGWLDELLGHPERRKWLEENVSGVLLVQIRDNIDRKASTTDGCVARIGRSLEGLTSPLSAVLSAREGVMRFRNDEQVEAIARRFEGMNFPKGFFQQETFPYEGDAALSWYLTREECADLQFKAKRDVEAKAKALLAWWDGPPEGKLAATSTAAAKENIRAESPML